MNKTNPGKPDSWTHHHTFLFGLILVLILIFVLDRKYSTRIPPPSEPSQSVESRNDSPVVLEVLADADAAVPGKELILGFLFAIKPGWHIYGPQPGDAGGPTEVSFSRDNSLPAPKVEYPPVKTFREPGDITVYGYENQVMLLAAFQTPSSPPGQSLTITGTVSWLACREVCVPGEQEFRVELPVRDAATETHSDVFSVWKKRIAETGVNGQNP